eukprot:5386512-Pyramimonas_sp.AAC.1
MEWTMHKRSKDFAAPYRGQASAPALSLKMCKSLPCNSPEQTRTGGQRCPPARTNARERSAC